MGGGKRDIEIEIDIESERVSKATGAYLKTSLTGGGTQINMGPTAFRAR